MRNYFDGDGTQNYLLFQPAYKHFEKVGNKISLWKSKELSEAKISSNATTSNNKSAANLVYNNARINVKFNGDFLKQDKLPYNHGPILNMYIFYKLTPNAKDSSITLENCLFGSIKLTKNAVIDK